MTVGPVLVAEQLPDASPLKAPATEFVKRYESPTAPARARASLPRRGLR
ncbi:MAG: hypothetical protein ABI460_01240 [Caldimonas sp.]